MDLHGPCWTHVHLHQVISPVLLSTSVSGQPEVAATGLVDQPDIRHSVVFGGNWVLPLPVLARAMVLDAVLCKISCEGPWRHERSMRCHDSSACRDASDLWAHLRRGSPALTHHRYLEAPNITKEEARSGRCFFRRPYVSAFSCKGVAAWHVALSADSVGQNSSACLLELARIIDLEVDTDDQKDPSCEFANCSWTALLKPVQMALSYS